MQMAFFASRYGELIYGKGGAAPMANTVLDVTAHILLGSGSKAEHTTSIFKFWF